MECPKRSCILWTLTEPLTAWIRLSLTLRFGGVWEHSRLDGTTCADLVPAGGKPGRHLLAAPTLAPCQGHTTSVKHLQSAFTFPRVNPRAASHSQLTDPSASRMRHTTVAVVTRSMSHDTGRSQAAEPFMVLDDITRVALTGASLTGFTLDIERLTDAELREAQSIILGRLSRNDRPVWKAVAFGEAIPGLRYSGAPYETLIPSSFLSCSGAAARENFDHLPRLSRNRPLEHFDAAFEETEWTMVDCQVDVFSFGVGTIAATYQIKARQSISAQRFRVAVENVSQMLTSPYNHVLSGMVKEVKVAAETSFPSLVSAPWIQGAVDETAILHAQRINRLRRRTLHRRMSPHPRSRPGYQRR